MCSNFCPEIMDNYHGDLADIVRASTSTTTTTTTNANNNDGLLVGSSNDSPIIPTNSNHLVVEYQQLNHLYPSLPTDAGCGLLLDVTSASTTFRGGGTLVQIMGPPLPTTTTTTTNNLCNSSAPTITTSSSNIFSSNIVQISSDNIISSCNDDKNNINNNKVKLGKLPAASSEGVGKAGYGFMGNDNNTLNVGGGFHDGASAGVQIPFPRNNPAIKRRKIQAKKVVCIPAPAAANSRQTGEVVPSDLWAWRKYGQKPIKGSPYPRGYYRCSSSKGCSARKQVERSRTDPNMLVITYTSEHNHPWPTQRNALAGSTRSSSSSTHPSKTSSSSSKKQSNHHFHIDHLETSSNLSVKDEEMMRVNNTDDPRDMINDDNNKEELFNDSYRPLIVTESSTSGNPKADDQDHFFADLVEFESDQIEDPLKLFTNTSFGDLFDWTSNDTSTSTIEENGHHTTLPSNNKD